MTKQRLLLVILLLAVLVRVPAALYMGDQVTVLPGIHDQVSYDALAQSILAGRGYSFTSHWYPFTVANTPTAHWSFLYPLYLTVIYALTGYHPLIARLIQAAAGGLLISLLVYLIGRRVVDETTGLLGAALAAVYGYFVYYSAALMTETYFIVLLLLCLYLGLVLIQKPTLRRWVLLGLALGAAALLRQTMLLLVPFVLAWLIWELRQKKAAVRWWHPAATVVTIGLLLAPWTIRNYTVYHQFLLLNSNAGYAFYASTNPNLGNNWNNDEVVVPIPEEFWTLNEAQLDQALTRQAVAQIASDPQRYVLLTLNKTLEYFKFWPSADSSALSNFNRVFSFGLYLPFMLVGLGLSLWRWRRFAGPYLFMVVHTAIYLLTWPSPRYRLPVDAVLMVFAAMAVLELARLLAGWRRRTMLETPLISKSGN